MREDLMVYATVIRREPFPDVEIVASVTRQLTWTHIVEILPIKEQPERDFYAEICRIERWSVRTLRSKIRGMLFERTAISRKPGEMIKNELAELRDDDKPTPELVFRDTYFLGLRPVYV